MSKTTELRTLWEQFKALAERMEEEEKRNGGAWPETAQALDSINSEMAKLEAGLSNANRAQKDAGSYIQNGQRFSFPRGTVEGAQFERLLRIGMPRGEEAKAAVKLVNPLDWKAMSLTDGTTGGFMASEEFSNQLLAYLIDASPVRSIVNVQPSGSATFIQPVRSGIPAATRVSELGSRAATGDMAFKSAMFTPSELMASVLVSRAAVDDSRYDLAAAIAQAAADQFALTEGTEFVKGAKPLEMIGLNGAGALGLGDVTASGTSHSIAADDLVDLTTKGIKSVYLARARFLMTAKTLGAIRKLKASTGGSYLYEPTGYGPTLLDYPVTFAPDVTEVDGTTAGLPVVYFGDFRTAFLLVDRQEVVVQRLAEKYAETGQYEYLVYRRVGGGVVVPDAIARLITG